MVDKSDPDVHDDGTGAGGLGGESTHKDTCTTEKKNTLCFSLLKFVVLYCVLPYL